MLKYCPKEWKEGSKIAIPLEGINKSHVGLHIHVDQFPSYENMLCNLNNCPDGYFQNQTLILPYENWSYVSKLKCFMFGLYVFNGLSYYINFYVDHEI